MRNAAKKSSGLVRVDWNQADWKLARQMKTALEQIIHPLLKCLEHGRYTFVDQISVTFLTNDKNQYVLDDHVWLQSLEMRPKMFDQEHL